MTNAKKLLALLLAVLTFVSVAAIGVNAEEAKEETTTAVAETTTEKPTETTTQKPTTTVSPVNQAFAKLFVEGAAKKIVSTRIEITAPLTSEKIVIADTGLVNLVIDGTPIKKEAGEFSLSFADAHKVEKNEKGEITKASNKVETKLSVSGVDGEFVVIFDFTGEDAHGHRYNTKVGETVKPSYDDIGYTLYRCSCGQEARKEKVEKLPGKITKVNCGPDISVAKKGTFQIEPKIEKLGDVTYKVAYATSDAKIATVNDKGEVTGVAIGKAVITCTVTFTKDGKTETLEDKVNVKVTYSLIQWILVAAEAIITGSVFVWDLILDALGLMK